MPIELTPKDFIDLGVAGVLAFLLIKVFTDYQKLVVQITELVNQCVKVIEANKLAIERLDNARILELTEAIKEIRRAERATNRRASADREKQEEGS
jgi:hypothetical protein